MKHSNVVLPIHNVNFTLKDKLLNCSQIEDYIETSKKMLNEPLWASERYEQSLTEKRRAGEFKVTKQNWLLPYWAK